MRRFVDIAAPGAERIIDYIPEALAAHWPATIRNLFAHHPQAMIARTQEANGFTLIHGDVGEGNVLVPKAAGQERPLYIIDRQPFDWSLTTWLGVYDLAYAIVLDWESALRRQYEISILQAYHEQLRQKGVRDYSWQQLYDDYRLCIGMCIYIPVEYCRGRINKRWQPVWLPMLQRALTACDELNCSELWLANVSSP